MYRTALRLPVILILLLGQGCAPPIGDSSGLNGGPPEANMTPSGEHIPGDDEQPAGIADIQSDCNGNEVEDAEDLKTGFSVDCDLNGVPDECERDEDRDAVIDACDLCPDSDDALDVDADGVPDGCDNCPTLENPDQTDALGDGVDDACRPAPPTPGPAVGGGSSPVPPPPPPPPAVTVPRDAQYRIVIAGEGLLAGTRTGQPYRLEADLHITPTIDPLSDQFTGNGVNPVDVAIITDALPVLGQAGALWFGTNTSLSDLVGSTVGASAVDVAFVSLDDAAGSIFIELDGRLGGLPIARTNTLNIYTLTSSLFSTQIHSVLEGAIAIEITEGGDRIQGEIVLNGSSGFGGPFYAKLNPSFDGEASHRIFTVLDQGDA